MANCDRVTVDVPIISGGHAVTTSWVAGELIRPETTGPNSDILIIMTPGATETSRYFEVSVRPEIFNSALALRDAGYTTLTVDRLGTRDSGQPISRQVTSVTQAAAVHALIASFRAGEQAFTPTKIVTYGHSIGSMVTILENAIYRDTDAIVLTGYAHAPSAEAIIAAIYATTMPAEESTELPNNGWDHEYLTNQPLPEGGAPETIPCDIVQYMRSVMQVVSANEADGVPPTVEGFLTELVTVPTFLALGGADAIFCGPLAPGNDCTSAETIKATEAPRFPNAPVFDTFILPDAPHEVQLDINAPQLSAALVTWLNTNVGTA